MITATDLVSHRARAALVLLLAPAVCILLYLRDPAHGGIYPPCPFHALTGKDCPGCGTLRAMHQLMHGHVGAAFGLNAFAVLMLPALAYASVSMAFMLVRGRPLPDLHPPRPLVWALPILVGVFWLVRNLPWSPVSWMSSYH